MSQLLISFCNVYPRGFSFGVYDFQADRLMWIDLSEIKKDCLGVDGICVCDDGYWILPQVDQAGVSSLAHLDWKLKVINNYPLTLTGDAHSLIKFNDGFLITDTKKNRINYVTVDRNDCKVNET